MAAFITEKIVSVHHWNDTLFSFTTTRDRALRYENGQFVMIGLEVEGRPLMRAYSIASANYEENLEFFSIKVPDGPLTSRLQRVQPGDAVLVSRKPTGTLVLHDLLPGKHLYLFSTGTGLAPFMSVIRDLDVYERFEKVVLIHGVRYVSEVAYEHYITHELPQHEVLGESVSEKLIYYPTVTRDPFRNRGRIPDLITSGRLFDEIKLPAFRVEHDRVMICGSPGLLVDAKALLATRGYVEGNHGEPGDFVVEKAFVER